MMHRSIYVGPLLAIAPDLPKIMITFPDVLQPTEDLLIT